MNGMEFTEQLATRIKRLPKTERSRILDYYNELIADKIETGITEEEVVAGFGNVEDVANRLLAENGERPVQPGKKLSGAAKVWMIVLVCITSPIWLSLAIAAIAVGISLFASLWAVVVALYASAVGCMLVGLISWVPSIIMMGRNLPLAFFDIGMSLAAIGIGGMLFIGTLWLSILSARLTAFSWKKFLLLFRKETWINII